MSVHSTFVCVQFQFIFYPYCLYEKRDTFWQRGGSMKIKLQEYIEAFKAKYVWAIF